MLEIRTYAVREGSGERVAQLLEAVVAPLLVDAGIDVVATGASRANGAARDHAYLVLAHARDADVASATARVEALPEWHDGRRDDLVALIESEHRVVLPRAVVVGLGYRS